MNFLTFVSCLSVLHTTTGLSLSAHETRLESRDKHGTKTDNEQLSSNHSSVLGKGVCGENPCLNGGSCTVDHDYIDGYRCTCRPTYKGVRCKELFCKVCLLKDAPLQCRIKRALDRHKRQKAFALVTKSNVLRPSRPVFIETPQMVVHSHKEFIKEASTNPFTIEWYMKMQDTINANSDAQNHFTLIDKKFHDQPSLKDFSTIFEYFYKLHRQKSAMSVLRQMPSVEANFFKDRDFVEQRFAGANVWQVYRVTNDAGDNGLNWQSIQTKLNRHFNWNNAVNSILGTNDEQALEQAIADKKLFISWYPELDGVSLDRTQLVDLQFSNRTAIKLTAPITMFIMNEINDSEQLETVAIQADAIPEARVFTPADRQEWFFAKSLVQRADFNVLQIIHKWLKVNLVMEPFCLLMERAFSEFHPVYDMLQFHCRATLETNKLYDMKLYGQKGPLFSLLSIDYSTSVEIINKHYKKMTFNDLDLENDLKKRGLDEDSVLPYFPYRDDGRLIVDSIKTFINRYVDLYYRDDSDVQEDNELQQWVDLVSIDGNKTALSRGMVKNFPKRIKDRRTLKKVLSRLIWQATGYHAAVTFPQLEYGGFLPNAPFRLFADEENNAVFSNYMFGNKVKALDQVEFYSDVASSHLDKLLDYGTKLQDAKARKLLVDFSATDLVKVTKKMAFANAVRVKDGHLPYPYLLPDFITNSAST